MLIGKDLILSEASCPTQAWRIACDQGEDDSCVERTPGEQLRLEEGIEIGRRARRLWPEGRLIDARDIERAAAATARGLAERPAPVLFEAAFLVDGRVARADVLEPTTGGWHLIEVKSNVEEDERLLDDLACTAATAMAGGVSVVRASLLLVDRRYRLGQPDRALFRLVDRTDEVLSRVPEVDDAAVRVAGLLRRQTPPIPRMVRLCRDCPYFTRCVGKGLRYPLLDLPRVEESLLESLWAAGHRELADLRAEDVSTDEQRAVVAAVARGGLVVQQAGLRKALRSIRTPTAYLDFETVKTAIPLWRGVAPHEQVLTQYSVQFRPRRGSEPVERARLARHDRDDRKALASQLVADLVDASSIVVYSSFERTIIRGLAKRFPSLTEPLLGIDERLVDLMAATKPSLVAHPEFHGRTSLKVLLPVLVPDLRYDALAIRDGDTALAAFAALARGRREVKEAERVRQDLLAYCATDTLAMLRLHDRLQDMASDRRVQGG